MPQQELAVREGEENSRFRSIQEIFRNPADKAKLQNMVDEAVQCKTRIDLQNATIKQLRDEAKKQFSLSPKIFNYYVSMVHSNDYSSRKDQLDQLDALVNAVMGLLPADHSAYQGNDD